MYKPSQYNRFFFEKNGVFLFNSFSKACVKIEKSQLQNIKKILNKKNITSVEKDFQDFLLKSGFIIPEEKDELKILEYLYNANYFLSDKITIALIPTYNCNFKCPYCFEESSKNNDFDKDYFNVLKKFSENNFKAKSKVHISLFGGEPLLKKDEIFSYFEYLLKLSNKYKFKLSNNLVTNGYLLDLKTFKRILKFNCSSIQITIDGSKESHNNLRRLHNNQGTFDIVVNNLKTAVNYSIKKKLKIRFVLRVNLKNQDIQDIISLLNNFSKEERKRINILFRPIYSTNSYKECNKNNIYDLKKFYDKAKEFGFLVLKSSYYLQYCESDGGLNFFYITPDLKLWKCVNQSKGIAEIGKIDKQGVMTSNLQNISQWYEKSNPFNDKKCRTCYYLPICYGGCVIAFINTGKRRCTSKDIAITPYFYEN